MTTPYFGQNKVTVRTSVQWLYCCIQEMPMLQELAGTYKDKVPMSWALTPKPHTHDAMKEAVNILQKQGVTYGKRRF